MVSNGCGRLSSKIVGCATLDACASWGILGTEPMAPAVLSTSPVDMATFDCKNIIGRFTASFVCVISLNYLYDSEGSLLKDSMNKVLIED